MSIALVTTITNNYIPAMQVLLSSIEKHTTRQFKFIAIEEEPILESNKILFKKYNNVHFSAPLYDAPNIKNNGKRCWNINPANRFSIFLLEGYKKIIFLDSDMICLSNIDELLDCNVLFGAVYHPHPDGYGSTNIPSHNELYKDFCHEKSFNAGLMVIDSTFLNKKVVNELIKISDQSCWLGNQGPLNIFFNKHVTLLPSNYFLSTPYITSNNFNDIKFLHYGGSKKPWSTSSMDMKDNYSDFVIRNVANNMGTLGHMVLLKLLYKYKKALHKLVFK